MLKTWKTCNFFSKHYEAKSYRIPGMAQLSKHFSKWQKCQKIKPDTKVSEAVCRCDWHNVRSYLFFLTCEHFGLSVQGPLHCELVYLSFTIPMVIEIFRWTLGLFRSGRLCDLWLVRLLAEIHSVAKMLAT